MVCRCARSGRPARRRTDTLYPRCNSWYLGANIPGKPRIFMPFIGYPAYQERLREVVSADYAVLTRTTLGQSAADVTR